MNIIEKLPKWFESKPLVLLRFDESITSGLHNSRYGFSRCTIARPHEEFDELKVPTLCLIELASGKDHEFYIGVITAKVAVSTFDTRITLIKLQALTLPSLPKLAPRIAGKSHQNSFKRKLATKSTASKLSPKLGMEIVRALSKDAENKAAIEKAASQIPRLRTISKTEWAQVDAIRTAVAAFGLDKSAMAEFVETADGSDSGLDKLDVHALEDNVIAKDASQIPSFTLDKKHVTGHAIFTRANERLDVYTANKGPLEEMLGVDLIYINDIVGNIVMVQYKMLTLHRTADTSDWIYRPDSQFKTEVARMKLPAIAGKITDYRMHRDPFFFKFVRRKGDGESHQSFVLSLDHLKKLLALPRSRGIRGGIRLSYQDLGGAYLRELDLIGLIRSGYIGTHTVESKALSALIKAVAKGNRALVLAWQRRIQSVT